MSTGDPIQTWSVSEVDKKGKKKKGTLGVGNGAVFFASESDKVCYCRTRRRSHNDRPPADTRAEVADGGAAELRAREG
jgi:hypothetical protein